MISRHNIDEIKLFAVTAYQYGFSSLLNFNIILQLTHPLCDRNLIYARLDAVSEISESMGSCRESHDKHMQESETSCNLVVHSELGSVLSSVLTMLGRSPDVQRGITRIFHRTATPKEVMRLLFCSLLLMAIIL